jgi:hypothetical protein
MTIPKKLERRSTHRTQWAAQFAVASELCKRGYEVAITLGNHPAIDLMVRSPNGIPFFVDVKGQYKKNFWPVSRQRKRKDLFYILAYVPDDDYNRFFILTQGQVNNGITRNFKQARSRRKAKRRTGEPVDRPGIKWNLVELRENCWNSLPR